LGVAGLVMMHLEHSLCTVHPQLLSCVVHDRLVHSRVWRLLEMLNVKKHTPEDLIHHHIVPLLKNPEVRKHSPLFDSSSFILN
jgi:hypothetical protein